MQPARLKLDHVGIPAEKLFISGADGKNTREDILRAALNQAGRSNGRFDKVVYIGDALWDVTTTRNLQLSFVGIRYRHDLELLQRAGASHVLPNYLDLERFLLAVQAARPPEVK